MRRRVKGEETPELYHLKREILGELETLAEARRILSEFRPDIIISDWSMPEISGIDFLREAARNYPDSFRIVLTGYGHVGDVISEISSGIVQLFIPKPWSETEMRRNLERAAYSKF